MPAALSANLLRAPSAVNRLGVLPRDSRPQLYQPAPLTRQSRQNVSGCTLCLHPASPPAGGCCGVFIELILSGRCDSSDWCFTVFSAPDGRFKLVDSNTTWLPSQGALIEHDKKITQRCLSPLRFVEQVSGPSNACLAWYNGAASYQPYICASVSTNTRYAPLGRYRRKKLPERRRIHAIN